MSHKINMNRITSSAFVLLSALLMNAPHQVSLAAEVEPNAGVFADLAAAQPVRDMQKAAFIAHAQHMGGGSPIWRASDLAQLLFEAHLREDVAVANYIQLYLDLPESERADCELLGMLVEFMRANGYQFSVPTRDAEALITALEAGTLAQFFKSRLPVANCITDTNCT